MLQTAEAYELSQKAEDDYNDDADVDESTLDESLAEGCSSSFSKDT